MQLTWSAAASSAALVIASSAAGDPVVALDGRGAAYVDDDATWVVTSAAGAEVTPVPVLTVSGEYLIDVVSSASIDVVSAATGRFEDVRHQGRGGLAYHDDDRSISGTYVYSVEHDWRSHTGALSFTHDALQHNLTLGVSGVFTFNQIGRSGDANFEEELVQGTVNGDVAITASKDDLVGLTYTFVYSDGYQASPYRYVRFFASLPTAAVSEHETMPRQRARHALGARWNHHLFGKSALRLDGRGYIDSWGVASGTLAAELALAFGDFELGPFVRGYGQRAAEFFRSVYTTPTLYATSDRELSTFVDFFGGLRLGVRKRDLGVVQEFRAEIRATGFAIHAFDFPARPNRAGFIGELGTGVSFE